MLKFFRSRLFGFMAGFLIVCPAFAASEVNMLAALNAYKSNDINALNAIVSSSSQNNILSMYPKYWAALIGLKQDNDSPAREFLSIYRDGVLSETLRNSWLKFLGKKGDWKTFIDESKNLPASSVDEETGCYAQIIKLQQNQAVSVPNSWLSSGKLPDGCNSLIIAAARVGVIKSSWIKQRIRYLLASNYISDAQSLAISSGFPLNLKNSLSNETALYKVVSLAKKDPISAAIKLNNIEIQLNSEQTSFAWGQLALSAAKKLNSAKALIWYEKANPKQLSNEQFEWWARSALRNSSWLKLDSIIRKMPLDLQDSTTWRYWRARALARQGRFEEANALYSEVSGSGRNFYALLAKEELGSSVYASKNTKYQPSFADLGRVAGEPAIRRALALFRLSNSQQRPEFRNYARQEWRWATRNRSDQELLAAAKLASQNQFIEMSIYTADQTKTEHNFSLRYPTPYRSKMQYYSNAVGLDEAWVYGLIRQESRFVILARSGVGASGLMQVMPSTARLIAKKLGESNYSLSSMDTNIRYGTWYLQNINEKLGDEVLATAGYNAGPNRALAWQDSRKLEGAIYAETIPFNETRAYVKKVMTNATYYAYNFGEKNISLKRRLGFIPAK